MQVHNLSWTGSICRPRALNELNLFVPGVPPELPKPVQDIIDKTGTRITLEKGKIIDTDASSSFIYLRNGLVGRTFSAAGKEHIMEMVTSSKCVHGEGSFFNKRKNLSEHLVAMVNSQIISVPLDLLRKLLETDGAIMRDFYGWHEKSLSYRLSSLSLMTVLPAEERVKAFFLAWILHYGALEGDTSLIRIPFIIQRKYLQSVTRSSKCTLDSILTDWNKKELLLSEKNWMVIKSRLFDSSFDLFIKEQISSEQANAGCRMWLESVLPKSKTTRH